MNPTRIDNNLLTVSCSRAMRENSWETATKRVKTDTKKKKKKRAKKKKTKKNKSEPTKVRKKGMSTENNIGVQTRAMAQQVDNEENPEQVQKAMDQATTPTVVLHRTKEDIIKEFVRQHGTISLGLVCTRPLQH